MIEQIISPSDNCNCNCGGKSNIIATIDLGDTFKLAYHFNASNMVGPYYDLNSFDLTAQFYILGYEENKITFVKPEESNETCIVDQFKSMIKFIFNNYNLKPGKLYAKYIFKLKDPEVPEGSVDIVEKFTGIILQ